MEIVNSSKIEDKNKLTEIQIKKQQKEIEDLKNKLKQQIRGNKEVVDKIVEESIEEKEEFDEGEVIDELPKEENEETEEEEEEGQELSDLISEFNEEHTLKEIILLGKDEGVKRIIFEDE